jgi:methionine aminopeptidase
MENCESKIENNEHFDIDILKYLGDKHKEMMNNLRTDIDSFETNKDIYENIYEFMIGNLLKPSFPIGISINHVIAHDSYHEKNLITLKKGDFITIDVGFIENGNIIDAARTFNYRTEKHKSISDCESYVDRIEKYIRDALEENGKVLIQGISGLTDTLVASGGYSGIGFLGGHNVKLNKVHGEKMILGKPLTSLPEVASTLINKNETLSKNEMFCIEIYMSERFTEGQMIQSTRIPVTHFELDDKADTDKMKSDEKKMFEIIKEKTNGLAYSYLVHDEFNSKDNKMINNLINKKFIVSHNALEFKTGTGSLVKFTQHENTFIITSDGELINLTKDE